MHRNLTDAWSTYMAFKCFLLIFWQRRGVVKGIDFGETGEVKKIDVSRIRDQLDKDCIVIVSNLGYSSTGEVLNCKYAYLLFWKDLLFGLIISISGVDLSFLYLEISNKVISIFQILNKQVNVFYVMAALYILSSFYFKSPQVQFLSFYSIWYAIASWLLVIVLGDKDFHYSSTIFFFCICKFTIYIGTPILWVMKYNSYTAFLMFNLQQIFHIMG